MAKAGKATLVQVGDLESGPTPLIDAEAYLRLHGVDVETKRLERRGKEPVAEMLLAQCIDAGASCLIMGAYTHSPWRELVLGSGHPTHD